MTTSQVLPTGTVTFLFTDIEGSTRLLQQLGDRFGDLLDDHHHLIRDAVADAGGVEVSTEGDAFFVVFPSAPDAVRGAARAQRALADHAWGEGITVRVRMGMHTGLAARAGDNYGGIDVHRAARIAAAAHGEQVLLSAATAALAEQGLPPGVTLKELGEFHLKDLEHPERLHQLCIDGLTSDFPAPRAQETRLTNLPPSPTSLVGRERERETVWELLRCNRLVTLTGPGGTGKTRLGMAVAERALGSFSDGVFMVQLAPLEDQRLVPSTIAHTLGLREQGVLAVDETLREHLADKELLLLLDNFEQVVEGAITVSQLLEAAPRVKVLVTSRTPLRVAGEQEYPVPPLGLPGSALLPPLDALSRYEAVELFVQRARAASPGFALSDDNAAAVIEICRRLDGLPLAIELAAARIRIMSADDIARRLHTGLSLLTGGARDLPERQRTLRNAIGWSYDLLDEAHRRFFRRLGVFVGGFDFDSAGYVTAAETELGIDSLNAVEVLLDNSLIRRHEPAAGVTRFRMLQTIREFALECLASAAEDEGPTRQRHAEWYTRFTEDVSPRFTAGFEALDATEREHDNIRAVLRWAIDSRTPEIAMRVASQMWRFWQLRGHLAEARRWLTEVVTTFEESQDVAARARTLMALGSITYWQNDFDVTRRYYEQALAMLRGVGDAALVQEALYNVGFLSLLQRDFETAREVFTQSRGIAEQREDKKGLADTAWGLAMAALHAKDWEQARRWGAECGRLYEELGDVFGQSLAVFTHYQVARYTGDLAEARRLMRRYVEEAGRIDTGTPSSGLEMMAEIELLEGRIDRAVKMRAASEALREEYGGGSPPPLIDLTDVKQAAVEALGEDAAERLWQEGRSMSLDEAVALIMKDPAS